MMHSSVVLGKLIAVLWVVGKPVWHVLCALKYAFKTCNDNLLQHVHVSVNAASVSSFGMLHQRQVL